jgi:ribonuclease HII
MKSSVVLLVTLLVTIISDYAFAMAVRKPNVNHKPLRLRRSDPIQIERELVAKRGYEYVVGSDESGCGCLAGPIATASCCIVTDLSAYVPIEGVDDSKLLSPDDRERIYNFVVNNPEIYQWSITTRSNEDIDATSVQDATIDGFQESIETLASKIPSRTASDQQSLYSIVDGHRSPRLPFTSRPWKGGDAIVYTVALASILARVTHDIIMHQAAKDYPDYGFQDHRGYPTRSHVLALHNLGPCPLHRKSCKPVQGKELSRKDFGASLVLAAALLLAPTESRATTYDPKTGASLPDPGEIESAIPQDWLGIDNPLGGDSTSSQSLSMGRLDSSSDAIFYNEPRLVEHVDTQCVQLMTTYISQNAIVPGTQSVLDLCSSWNSHISTQIPLQRVAGLGMNAKELESNSVLTEWTVQDLNEKPVLPYHDAAFDVILLQLSIDYLTRPLEVCKEMGRVLKPGGKVHIMFSNRLFLSKAVALWTGSDDIDHAFTVGSYLHFCQGGLFQQIEAHDFSVRKGRDKRIVGDPLYVVTAMKG